MDPEDECDMRTAGEPPPGLPPHVAPPPKSAPALLPPALPPQSRLTHAEPSIAAVAFRFIALACGVQPNSGADHGRFRREALG